MAFISDSGLQLIIKEIKESIKRGVEGDLDITEHLDKKWLTKEEMAAFDFAAADLPIIDILN